MRFDRVVFAAVSAAAAFAGLALLPSASAAADPPAPAARLDVDANPGCSSRDELVARVAARSTRIRFVADGAGVPALTARIAVAPRGGVIAELTVVDPDGRRFARRLEAPSCAAATDALALVVAITLDPSVATADASKAAPTVTAPAAPATPGAPASPAQEAQPPPPPREHEGPEAIAAAPAPAEIAEEARHLTARVAGGAIWGPAPTLMPGFGIEVEAGIDRSSIWSPALMLSLAHVWSGDVNESGAIASFILDLAALDVCPARVVLLRMEARVCAVGSVGRLAAQGSHTYDPRSVARPFATAGGSARLALPFGSRVQLAIRLGVGGTLWRDAFEFTPEVFHRAASVTLVGDVGVGVRFP